MKTINDLAKHEYLSSYELKQYESDASINTTVRVKRDPKAEGVQAEGQRSEI